MVPRGGNAAVWLKRTKLAIFFGADCKFAHGTLVLLQKLLADLPPANHVLFIARFATNAIMQPLTKRSSSYRPVGAIKSDRRSPFHRSIQLAAWFVQLKTIAASGLTIASIIGKIRAKGWGARATKYHVGFQPTKIQFLQSHSPPLHTVRFQSDPRLAPHLRFATFQPAFVHFRPFSDLNSSRWNRRLRLKEKDRPTATSYSLVAFSINLSWRTYRPSSLNYTFL